MLHHEAIRDTEDRDHLDALLAGLAGEDDDERAECVWTLQRLADPRGHPRLAEMLCNRSLPDFVRAAAGQALRDEGAAGDDPNLRRYWQEGDLVLQRHALLSMSRADADLVEPVARDPAHPLHAESIATMEWGFEESRFQAFKIAALQHADPRVRETAANVLVWDEPVGAEAPLLDAAADREVAVAREALRTLEYYKSCRCFRRLHELRASAAPEIQEELDFRVLALRREFAEALSREPPPVRERLDVYVAPIAGVLALDDEEVAPISSDPSPPRTAPPARERETLAVDEVIALLSDLGGAWAAKKERLHASRVVPENDIERRELLDFLFGHPDGWVRCEAAQIAAGLGDHDAVLRLAGDPSFRVRKSSVYYLGEMTPRADVAAFLRSHLASPGVTSTHASEALRSWVVHAPRAEALTWLTELASQDPRESVRTTAVYALDTLGAGREVGALHAVLIEPPLVTWEVHRAVLWSSWRLGVSIDRRWLSAVADVDNLDLRVELARALGV